MPGPRGVQGQTTRAAQQAAARVSEGMQFERPEVPVGATPTIAQVALAQGHNLGTLRILLEDLAKGVLEMSKVVGNHTRSLKDFTTRIEAIEHELGVEIDVGADGEGEAVVGDELATEPDVVLAGDGTDEYVGDGGEFVDEGDYAEGDYAEGDYADDDAEYDEDVQATA
jgi:hypothetical protein